MTSADGGATAEARASAHAGPVSPLAASREGPPVSGRSLIGGRWLEGDEGARLEARCPTTGAVLGSVPSAGKTEARDAVEAAAGAFEEHWSGSPVEHRAALLRDTGSLLLERREELSRLIALEAGKPLTEARGEVGYAAGFLEFFADEVLRRPAQEERGGAPGKRVHVARRPVGPAALLTVWNFPVAGVTRPLAAALAAGCTAVVKPSERVPLCAVAVFETLVDAGLPAGVANLVGSEDPATVADELLRSPEIRKLSFTGSARVGERLRSGAGLKRVTLELGGSAPYIAFEDADLESAVEGAMRSKFRNGGQTCICADRFYVHGELLEEFTRRFAERAAGLRIGDPLEEGTEIGPLIDAAGAERLEAQIADALSLGARIVTGSERARRAGPDGGYFFEPTVLAGATREMLVMREESFGPVAAIASFRTEDEVIAAANELPGGLAAFSATGDPERAARLAARLEFGIVGINDPLPAAPGLPFGGVKGSGLGREGGREGLDEFLETQLVSLGPG